MTLNLSAPMIEEGFRPCEPALTVPGGKNIAMPVLALIGALRCTASILNVPRIADIDAMLEVLHKVGAEFKWIEQNRLTIDARRIDKKKISLPGLLPDFRGAIYLSALPLTCCVGANELRVGGDKISGRSLRPHIRAICGLGHRAHLIDEQRLEFSPLPYVRCRRDFVLDDKGISATCLALILAACQDQRVVIRRASLEHEVIDFCEILRQLGTVVYLKGRTLTTKHLSKNEIEPAVQITIPSDIVTAGTAVVSAALRSQPLRFKMIGARWRAEWLRRIALQASIRVNFQTDGSLTVDGMSNSGFNFSTGFPPLLPADLQPIFTVFALGCYGPSVLKDCVYLNRFDHVAQLIRAGALISRRKRVLRILPSKLSGTIDLAQLGIREQAALRIAQLAHNIELTSHSFQALWRGYEQGTALTNRTFDFQ